MNMKAGRNDPCPCGSGKKYKHCCWGKEEKKTYTPSGKRKFKATFLSSSEKSQQIFGNTASTQAMPTELPEPGSLLKFRKTTKSYQKEEVVADKSGAEVADEAKKPSAPVKEKKDIELPFEPTKKDFQKEEKE